MDSINVLNFADAKLFLSALRRFDEENPFPNYFRGQANADWYLQPSACRRDHRWTREWIEPFIETNRNEYRRFVRLMWKNETEEQFMLRFELALRKYVENEIIFRFQEFAREKQLIAVSAQECVRAANCDQILDYLQEGKIPLTQKTRYVALLAQHHGVPTRLLDWSSSLDVAIDFALSGVSDFTSTTDRIVVWAFNQWGNKIYSADRDCDEQRLSIVLTETGEARVRYMIESLLHGTCLKLFNTTVDSTGVMQIMPHIPATVHGRTSFQLNVDDVDEVYINEQKGKAMIDMRQDRYVYDNSFCQSVEARLSECPIPTDKVFKFTLPHSMIPWLRPQLEDSSVRRIYDLPMYDQFDDIEPNREVSQEERRQRREHNFLTELGERLRTDIDWDELRT